MKKLAFGLMRLPLAAPDDYANIDREVFKRMADRFLAAEFTHFDTAYFYHGGQSEIALREAVVHRYPRSAFTITDKLPVHLVNETADVRRLFNEQLERCGVDYFDYYWLHAMSQRRYEACEQHNIFDFIARKKAEGRIRTLGFSFHDTAEVLDRILTEHPEFEYVQLQINYLDWEDPDIQSRLCYETAIRHNRKIMIMEPIKGGSLARLPAAAERIFRDLDPTASMASWALRFCASLPGVEYVLSGMSTYKQLEENIETLGDKFCPLSAEEQEAVKAAARIIRESVFIPCTACNYCLDHCPQNIGIPHYFRLYNELQAGTRPSEDIKTEYAQLTRTYGRPDDCLACKFCERSCPQHIGIVKHLEEVAAAFAE
ncbi:MAG: 4Fe-4S dicluster domain-containing protein [Clostridiaceae bacterium]|nr:4Fe-4S dicluster domain-containing protein [Clostridiaceae bacterium]